MPLDAAQWQIDIMAADKTAQAFRSVEQKMKTAQTQARATGAAMNVGMAGGSQGAKSLGKDLDSLLGLFQKYAPAITVAAAAWKVWNAGMAAADLGEQAEQLNVSTDMLQAYRSAAGMAGIQNTELDSVITKLNKTMGDAKDGNDDLIAKFDKLGVKLLNSKGQLRNVEEVLPELARGLLSVESATERNALMQELMGKSGAKMATVLQDLSKGNDALLQSAKSAGAIVSPENIAKWDALSDALQKSDGSFSALAATLTAPAAQYAADLLNQIATNANKATVALNALPKDASFFEKLDALFGGRTGGPAVGGWKQMATEAERLQISLGKAQADLNKPENADRRGIIQDEINMLQKQLNIAEKAHATITASKQRLYDADEDYARRHKLPASEPSTGTGQPLGKGAKGAGADIANKQLEESKKRLDQLFDDFEKLRKKGEELTDKWGDGSQELARKTAELNEIFQLGYIDADTYSHSIRELGVAAEQQDRAFRAARGGFDAFAAGFEQGLVNLSTVNREFEYGKKAVDLLGESIDILAGVSNKSFGQMALDFALMVAKMETAAAASAAWKAIGGFSGIASFFGFGGGGAIPEIGGGIMDMSVPMLAGGGDFDGAAIVGENGPELVTGRGTVYNRDQLSRMRGGGGSVVNVYQTVHVGEYVTATQYRQGLIAVERSARVGARQGIIADGQRGDPVLSGALR